MQPQILDWGTAMESAKQITFTDHQIKVAIALVAEHIVDINRTRMHHPHRFDEWNNAMDEAQNMLSVLTAAQDGKR